MTCFVLPWPPGVNSYYRNLRGRTLLSKKGRQYKQDVAASVLSQGVQRFGDNRLRLSVTLHAPTRRRYDCDGRLKALQDALEHSGIFDDDEQVDELHVYRGDIVKNGKCVVELEVIG